MSLLSQTESIHHVAKVLRNNPHLTGTTVIFHMYSICRFKRFHVEKYRPVIGQQMYVKSHMNLFAFVCILNPSHMVISFNPVFTQFLSFTVVHVL